MLAFGHVMDEPEDLLQMVLGMTSPVSISGFFCRRAAGARGFAGNMV